MISRKPAAYMAPSVSMEFRRWRPVRNATSSRAGVGARPCDASAAATIMASDVAGSRPSAITGPTSGSTVTSDMAAMDRKNSAASASGCWRKVRMPCCTHCRPVRAGTMRSFMG
jgi:hypothetical protein